jgi:hypothetical protein
VQACGGCANRSRAGLQGRLSSMVMARSEATEHDGKIESRNVRLKFVMIFQWVTRRFRDVRCLPAMYAGSKNAFYT